MIKLFLSTLFLIQSVLPSASVIAQGQICDYTITDPTRLKVFYPCEWNITEGLRDNVKKVFVGSAGAESLSVTSFPVSGNYKLNLEETKTDWATMGKVLSARETRLENLPTIEMIVESENERPVGIIYTKVLGYLFIYNNNLIGISYSCQGLNKEAVNKYFATNLYQYKVLASRTILLDKHQ